MARIRSIKPEMFRSFTISGWPRDIRWTFAGLLTYCDDHGRGADDARLIKAEVCPLDDDVPVKKVEQHLAQIAATGPLCRYESGGRRWLHITSWREHQKVNRPTPSRIPPCPLHESSADSSPHPPSGLREDSVSPHGTDIEDSHSPRSRSREDSRPRPQARVPAEQGAGSREQGAGTASPPAARGGAGELIPLAAPVTAQTLVAEWVEHCQVRPPGRLVGQVAKQLGGMLAEGVPVAAVRAGLAQWHVAATSGPSGRHPATLPSFVHAAANGSRGRSTGDERVVQAVEAGRRIQAMADAGGLP